MKWYRKIILVVMALAVAGAVGYGFLPKPMRVDAATVSRGPLRVTIEEEGRTRVKDRFEVSAPVSGYARRLALDAGDAVAKGQTLFELEPLYSKALDPRTSAEAKARVSAAESSLNAALENAGAAKAEALYAASELERTAKLHKDGYVTSQQMEQAETRVRTTDAALRSSEFAVEVARYGLEAARTALKYHPVERGQQDPGAIAVRSPVEGRVLKVMHKSAGPVSEGQPLIEIGNPRSLEVETDVLSADAVQLGPGTRALFERWGKGEPLDGRVRTIEPSGFKKISALGVEEQRVLVIADIVTKPDIWQRLGDGYRVEAVFILWEGTDVLQTPASALFRVKDGWAVFVVEEDRARLRPVVIGQRSALSVEIVSGLNQGDEVITHPFDSLSDGARVRVRQAEGAGR
ncbi:MAG: efflux RND transporter periplasmic adaptor subunit [Deltaproteobacteria bacterium]|nr:efflux RND transporter periplasmic adaptor subunit [Deltaproteobacteria bacterium]